MSWRAVALAEDVAPGATLPVVAFGEEFVAWRTPAGRLSLWRDRCPHRGMRLSFGFVRGETLACLYHGWRWRADGGCAHIPAHPDLDPPASLRVDAPHAVEAGGLVWLWRGEGAPGAPPPALPAPMRAARSLTVTAPEADLAAALEGWAPLAAGLRLGTVAGAAAALALRPKDDRATTLHLLVSDPARRRAASDWAEALRDVLEAA